MESSIAAAVSSVLATLHRLTLWSSDIGCLITLFSLHHIKLYILAISHATQVLVWVVPDDGCLVHKHILTRIIPVYKAISALNVEPLDCSADFCG